MNEVTAWLEGLGLDQYADLFAANDIDFDLLPELDEDALKEIGITSLGHRLRLRKAIAELSTPAAPQSAHQQEAERRQLTIMFCDLVGSTSLSERLDPEDLHTVVRNYQDCCARLVQKYGGRIVQYLGDGVMAYFGYPQADELDPERSVRAGLEIIEEIQRLEQLPGLRLHLRVGIATGQVVVGDLIGGSIKELGAIGETPNLAARLQSLATTDTLYIANSTRRLLGNLFQFRDLGECELKGLSKPVRVWQVLGQNRSLDRFDALHGTDLTPLEGRDAESETLWQLWQQAKTGRSHIVMISGEAGIGKSRLTRALRDMLADHSERYTELTYYCSPYFQNSALHPFISQLERAAKLKREMPADEKLACLETMIARTQRDVAHFTMLFAELLSIPTGDRYPPLTLSSQRLKEQTLDALLAQLQSLAHRGPVLVIYEDLHWIDPTSLELLERAIESLPNLPLLMVLTCRPEFESTWGTKDHITTIKLSRLDLTKGAKIVNNLTKGKPLPDAVFRQIVEKTDGVPLFIEELTKTVLEAGFLLEKDDRFVLQGVLPSLAVPSTLQDSLMARLDRLSPVKEIAQIGAVIGRQFSYELLAAVSPLAEHELRLALQQLADAELIYSRGEAPKSSYLFKHALVQDAAYNSLLKGRRQSLHSSIAKALEQKFPNTVETAPELLAHHYTGAELYQEAIRFWLLAGQRAIGRSAQVEAIGHLGKGLELLEQLPENKQRMQTEIELRRVLGGALIATRGYAADEVEKNCIRARALCERLDDKPQLFSVLYGLWVFNLARSYRSATEHFAYLLLDHAQPSGNPLNVLMAHSAFGITQLYRGNFAPAEQHLNTVLQLYRPEQSHDLIEQFGDDHGVYAHVYLAWLHLFCGRIEQSYTHEKAALALAEQLGNPLPQSLALVFAMLLHHDLRELENVADFSRRAIAVSTENGFPFWLSLGRCGHGWVLLQKNHIEDALTELEAGLAFFPAIQQKLPYTYWLSYLAEACLVSSRIDRGLQVVNEALALAAVNVDSFFEAELYRLKGELLVARGATQDAEQALHEALSIAGKQNAKWLELKAAVSLARVMGRNKTGPVHELLQRLYPEIDSHRVLPDLQEAHTLLQELA